MTIAVRAMTEADDLDALNDGNPQAWIARWWRDLDATEQVMRWWVGELDGEPVGFAAALPGPFSQGGNGVAIVFVHPDARRHGVGGLLLDEATRVVRGAGLPGVQLSWTEGDVDGEAAARAWDLREVARHRESMLLLQAIDRDSFAARAAAPGVGFTLLPVQDRSGDAWDRFYGFLAARFLEAPDAADGAQAPPSPVVAAMVGADPWSVVLAEQDGEWLGLTAVARRPGTDDVVNTFFTGVVPQARGRGLAGALKCHQALLMADAGMARLYTQNMDGNEPILAVNRALGFRPDSGYVDVVRGFAD